MVKTLESLLTAIAEGMVSMADGMQIVAEQLRRMADLQAAEANTAETQAVQTVLPPADAVEPGRPAEKAPPPAAEPAYVTDATGKVVTRLKKAAARKKKSRPATDIVLNVIQNSDGGTNNQTISQKTGFAKKKVANVLFQLKKAGKITAVARGIYKSA